MRGVGRRVPALPLPATGPLGALGWALEKDSREPSWPLCFGAFTAWGRVQGCPGNGDAVAAQLGEGRADPPPLPCSSGPGAPCPRHQVEPTGLLFPLRPYLPNTPDSVPPGRWHGCGVVRREAGHVSVQLRTRGPGDVSGCWLTFLAWFLRW